MSETRKLKLLDTGPVDLVDVEPRQPRDDWRVAAWDPKLILPTLWAEDTIDPDQRGPFQIIHCGDDRLARRVCGLLNAYGPRPEPA